MVRIPGDRGPSIKNRSSKHRLLLRDFKEHKRRETPQKEDSKKSK